MLNIVYHIYPNDCDEKEANKKKWVKEYENISVVEFS